MNPYRCSTHADREIRCVLVCMYVCLCMLGGVSVVANVRVSRIESVTHPTTISPALTEMVPGPTPAHGNTRNYVRTFVVVMEGVRACVCVCVCVCVCTEVV